MKIIPETAGRVELAPGFRLHTEFLQHTLVVGGNRGQCGSYIRYLKESLAGSGLLLAIHSLSDAHFAGTAATHSDDTQSLVDAELRLRLQILGRMGHESVFELADPFTPWFVIVADKWAYPESTARASWLSRLAVYGRKANIFLIVCLTDETKAMADLKANTNTKVVVQTQHLSDGSLTECVLVGSAQASMKNFVNLPSREFD